MATPITSPPLPPHTVRVKRKRNQDPLQALLIGQGTASKRSRTNSYVFKLASTEETPRHAGAITLLETSSPPPPEEETKEASNVLKVARNILNPARLFRFPTRKRRAEVASDEGVRRQPPPKRSEGPQTSTSQAGKEVSPVPIKAAEQSVPVSRHYNEIPKVKVLDQSPPNRQIAIPHSQATSRRRRSSTASQSLSPTSSYQIPAANEDELQKMVDLYLQLNHADESDKPSTTLKRPHHHTMVDALKERRSQQSTSGTASPDHKTRHVTGADSHMAAQNNSLKQKLETAALKSQSKVSVDPATILKAPEDAAVDSVIEDYVYDVYYREKLVGTAWEGGQYGLLLYNSDNDFEDLIFDEYDEDEEVPSEDEDSNAEDFYRNDYPDEDLGDEDNAFLSSSLDSQSRGDGADEVDADDFDEYDYDRCYQRFADDDGDRSIETGATLDDIIGNEDDGDDYTGGDSSAAAGYGAEDEYLDDSDRYRTRPRQWMPRTSDFADDEGGGADDDDSDY
ncbi:hypothetical protein V1509DRAFT_626558 [Lipomyces kononenkoae]